MTKLRGGDSGEKVSGRAHLRRKTCPKYMILGIYGVIWSDFGTFWSDLRSIRSINTFYIFITDPIIIDRLNQIFFIINTITIHLPLCLQNPHRRVVG